MSHLSAFNMGHRKPSWLWKTMCLVTLTLVVLLLNVAPTCGNIQHSSATLTLTLPSLLPTSGQLVAAASVLPRPEEVAYLKDELGIQQFWRIWNMTASSPRKLGVSSPRKRPTTLFAPSDEAFLKDPELAERLMSSPDAANDFVLNHAVEGAITTEQLSSNHDPLRTFAGTSLVARRQRDIQYVNNSRIMKREVALPSGSFLFVVSNPLCCQNPLKVVVSPKDLRVQSPSASFAFSQPAIGHLPIPLPANWSSSPPDKSFPVNYTMTRFQYRTPFNNLFGNGSNISSLASPPHLLPGLGGASFLTLLQLADCQSTLQGKGPITMFLPTDEAVASLAPDHLEKLVAKPDQLRQVLLYHIVPGALTSQHLKDNVTMTTVQGKPLHSDVYNNGTLTTVEGARVILSDIIGHNGVIHVIDRFLYPVPEGNLLQTLERIPRLSNLTTLLKKSNLTDLLTGETPYTLFAPVDEALKDLQQIQATPDGMKKIREILLGHFVPGVVYSASFAPAKSFSSASGGTVYLQYVPNESGGFSLLPNGVSIGASDIGATNGVVHVINQVMPPEYTPFKPGPSGFWQTIWRTVIKLFGAKTTPETIQPELPTTDFTTTLSKLPNTKNFQKILNNTEAPTQLQSGGPYTVFVPVDSAFEHADKTTMDILTTGDKSESQRLLQNHVVRGQFYCSDLLPLRSLSTLSGQTLEIHSSEVGCAKVNESDILYWNMSGSWGILHLVDKVLPLSPESVSTEVPGAEATTTIIVTEPTYPILVTSRPLVAPAPPPAPPATMNLTQVADQLNLTTFSHLLTQSGLEPILSANGPVTIFAPTETAFTTLRPDVLDGIVTRPDQLRKFLLYHCVPTWISAQDLPSITRANTLAGFPVFITVYLVSGVPNITINNAVIQPSQYPSTAGGVYLIDKVLEPPALGTISPTAQKFAPNTAENINKANLTPKLNEIGPFTAILPTNEAWQKLPKEVYDLITSNTTLLKEILLNHVIPGALYSSGLVVGGKFRTLGGKSVYVKETDGVITVNGSKIVQPDVQASNGVIHYIDTIIIPDDILHIATTTVTALTTTTTPPAVTYPVIKPEDVTPLNETLRKIGLTGFADLVDIANITNVLKPEVNYTVFAPTNTALDSIAEKVHEYRENPETLRSFVLYYIIVQLLPSNEITDDLVLPTLSGYKLIFNVYEDGKIITVSGGKIVQPDIPFSDGLIHVVDYPLAPPENKTLLQVIGDRTPTFSRLPELPTAIIDRTRDYKPEEGVTAFLPQEQFWADLPTNIKNDITSNRTVTNELVYDSVCRGTLYKVDLLPGTSCTTLSGKILTFTLIDGVYYVNAVPIVTFDIYGIGGVIHLLSMPLFFEVPVTEEPTTVIAISAETSSIVPLETTTLLPTETAYTTPKEELSTALVPNVTEGYTTVTVKHTGMTEMYSELTEKTTVTPEEFTSETEKVTVITEEYTGVTTEYTGTTEKAIVPVEYTGVTTEYTRPTEKASVPVEYTGVTTEYTGTTEKATVPVEYTGPTERATVPAEYTRTTEKAVPVEYTGVTTEYTGTTEKATVPVEYTGPTERATVPAEYTGTTERASVPVEHTGITTEYTGTTEKATVPAEYTGPTERDTVPAEYTGTTEKAVPVEYTGVTTEYTGTTEKATIPVEYTGPTERATVPAEYTGTTERATVPAEYTGTTEKAVPVEYTGVTTEYTGTTEKATVPVEYTGPTERATVPAEYTGTTERATVPAEYTGTTEKAVPVEYTGVTTEYTSTTEKATVPVEYTGPTERATVPAEYTGVTTEYTGTTEKATVPAEYTGTTERATVPAEYTGTTEKAVPVEYTGVTTEYTGTTEKATVPVEYTGPTERATVPAEYTGTTEKAVPVEYTGVTTEYTSTTEKATVPVEYTGPTERATVPAEYTGVTTEYTGTTEKATVPVEYTGLTERATVPAEYTGTTERATVPAEYTGTTEKAVPVEYTGVTTEYTSTTEKATVPVEYTGPTERATVPAEYTGVTTEYTGTTEKATVPAEYTGTTERATVPAEYTGTTEKAVPVEYTGVTTEYTGTTEKATVPVEYTGPTERATVPAEYTGTTEKAVPVEYTGVTTEYTSTTEKATVPVEYTGPTERATVPAEYTGVTTEYTGTTEKATVPVEYTGLTERATVPAEYTGTTERATVPAEYTGTTEKAVPVEYTGVTTEYTSTTEKATVPVEYTGPTERATVPAEYTGVTTEYTGTTEKATVPAEYTGTTERATVPAEYTGTTEKAVPVEYTGVTTEYTGTTEKATVPVEYTGPTERATVPAEYTGTTEKAVPVEYTGVTTEYTSTTEKATVPVEYTGPTERATVPAEYTGVTTEYTGTTEKATVPVEYTGLTERATVPAEYTGTTERASVPVEYTGVTTEYTGTTEKATVPVEYTGPTERATVPVEYTGPTARATVPAEYTGTTERAAEYTATTEKATVPVEYTGPTERATVPAEYTGTTERATVPAEYTGKTEKSSVPVEYTGATTEYTGTTEKATLPVEYTGPTERATVPAEFTGPTERATVPAEYTGPTEKATVPAEYTGTTERASVPVEYTGVTAEYTATTEKATVPVEYTGPTERVTVPAEYTGTTERATVPAEYTGTTEKASVPVEYTGATTEYTGATEKATVTVEYTGTTERATVPAEYTGTTQKASVPVKYTGVTVEYTGTTELPVTVSREPKFLPTVTVEEELTSVPYATTEFVEGTTTSAEYETTFYPAVTEVKFPNITDELTTVTQLYTMETGAYRTVTASGVYTGVTEVPTTEIGVTPSREPKLLPNLTEATEVSPTEYTGLPTEAPVTVSREPKFLSTEEGVTTEVYATTLETIVNITEGVTSKGTTPSEIYTTLTGVTEVTPTEGVYTGTVTPFTSREPKVLETSETTAAKPYTLEGVTSEVTSESPAEYETPESTTPAANITTTLAYTTVTSVQEATTVGPVKHPLHDLIHAANESDAKIFTDILLNLDQLPYDPIFPYDMELEPLTFFVPSDRAFSLLPYGFVPELLSNRDFVLTFVLSHLVPQLYHTPDFRDGLVLPTLQPGDDITIDFPYGTQDVITADGAIIIDPDNDFPPLLVVHVVDHLLNPPPNLTIEKILEEDFRTDLPQFPPGHFNNYLEDDQYTAFLPETSFLNQLPTSIRDQILSNDTLLRDIVRNHVCPGVHYASKFYDGFSCESLGGRTIIVNIRDGKYYGNNIPFVRMDVFTVDGVVHLLQNLLFPDIISILPEYTTPTKITIPTSTTPSYTTIPQEETTGYVTETVVSSNVTLPPLAMITSETKSTSTPYQPEVTESVGTTLYPESTPYSAETEGTTASPRIPKLLNVTQEVTYTSPVSVTEATTAYPGEVTESVRTTLYPEPTPYSVETEGTTVSPREPKVLNVTEVTYTTPVNVTEPTVYPGEVTESVGTTLYPGEVTESVRTTLYPESTPYSVETEGTTVSPREPKVLNVTEVTYTAPVNATEPTVYPGEVTESVGTTLYPGEVTESVRTTLYPESTPYSVETEGTTVSPREPKVLNVTEVTYTTPVNVTEPTVYPGEVTESVGTTLYPGEVTESVRTTLYPESTPYSVETEGTTVSPREPKVLNVTEVTYTTPVNVTEPTVYPGEVTESVGTTLYPGEVTESVRTTLYPESTPYSVETEGTTVSPREPKVLNVTEVTYTTPVNVTEPTVYPGEVTESVGTTLYPGEVTESVRTTLYPESTPYSVETEGTTVSPREPKVLNVTEVTYTAPVNATEPTVYPGEVTESVGTTLYPGEVTESVRTTLYPESTPYSVETEGTTVSPREPKVLNVTEVTYTTPVNVTEPTVYPGEVTESVGTTLYPGEVTESVRTTLYPESTPYSVETEGTTVSPREPKVLNVTEVTYTAPVNATEPTVYPGEVTESVGTTLYPGEVTESVRTTLYPESTPYSVETEGTTVLPREPKVLNVTEVTYTALVNATEPTVYPGEVTESVGTTLYPGEVTESVRTTLYPESTPYSVETEGTTVSPREPKVLNVTEVTYTTPVNVTEPTVYPGEVTESVGTTLYPGEVTESVRTTLYPESTPYSVETEGTTVSPREPKVLNVTEVTYTTPVNVTEPTVYPGEVTESVGTTLYPGEVTESVRTTLYPESTPYSVETGGTTVSPREPKVLNVTEVTYTTPVNVTEPTVYPGEVTEAVGTTLYPGEVTESVRTTLYPESTPYSVETEGTTVSPREPKVLNVTEVTYTTPVNVTEPTVYPGEVTESVGTTLYPGEVTESVRTTLYPESTPYSVETEGTTVSPREPKVLNVTEVTYTAPVNATEPTVYPGEVTESVGTTLYPGEVTESVGTTLYPESTPYSVETEGTTVSPREPKVLNVTEVTYTTPVNVTEPTVYPGEVTESVRTTLYPGEVTESVRTTLYPESTPYSVETEGTTVSPREPKVLNVTEVTYTAPVNATEPTVYPGEVTESVGTTLYPGEVTESVGTTLYPESTPYSVETEGTTVSPREPKVLNVTEVTYTTPVNVTEPTVYPGEVTESVGTTLYPGEVTESVRTTLYPESTPYSVETEGTTVSPREPKVLNVTEVTYTAPVNASEPTVYPGEVTESVGTILYPGEVTESVRTTLYPESTPYSVETEGTTVSPREPKVLNVTEVTYTTPVNVTEPTVYPGEVTESVGTTLYPGEVTESVRTTLYPESTPYSVETEGTTVSPREPKVLNVTEVTYTTPVNVTEPTVYPGEVTESVGTTLYPGEVTESVQTTLYPESTPYSVETEGTTVSPREPKVLNVTEVTYTIPVNVTEPTVYPGEVTESVGTTLYPGEVTESVRTTLYPESTPYSVETEGTTVSPREPKVLNVTEVTYTAPVNATEPTVYPGEVTESVGTTLYPGEVTESVRTTLYPESTPYSVETEGTTVSPREPKVLNVTEVTYTTPVNVTEPTVYPGEVTESVGTTLYPGEVTESVRTTLYPESTAYSVETEGTTVSPREPKVLNVTEVTYTAPVNATEPTVYAGEVTESVGTTLYPGEVTESVRTTLYPESTPYSVETEGTTVSPREPKVLNVTEVTYTAPVNATEPTVYAGEVTESVGTTLYPGEVTESVRTTLYPESTPYSVETEGTTVSPREPKVLNVTEVTYTTPVNVTEPTVYPGEVTESVGTTLYPGEVTESVRTTLYPESTPYSVETEGTTVSPREPKVLNVTEVTYTAPVNATEPTVYPGEVTESVGTTLYPGEVTESLRTTLYPESTPYSVETEGTTVSPREPKVLNVTEVTYTAPVNATEPTVYAGEVTESVETTLYPGEVTESVRTTLYPESTPYSVETEGTTVSPREPKVLNVTEVTYTAPVNATEPTVYPGEVTESVGTTLYPGEVTESVGTTLYPGEVTESVQTTLYPESTPYSVDTEGTTVSPREPKVLNVTEVTYTAPVNATEPTVYPGEVTESVGTTLYPREVTETVGTALYPGVVTESVRTTLYPESTPHSLETEGTTVLPREPKVLNFTVEAVNITETPTTVQVTIRIPGYPFTAETTATRYPEITNATEELATTISPPYSLITEEGSTFAYTLIPRVDTTPYPYSREITNDTTSYSELSTLYVTESLASSEEPTSSEAPRFTVMMHATEFPVMTEVYPGTTLAPPLVTLGPEVPYPPYPDVEEPNVTTIVTPIPYPPIGPLDGREFPKVDIFFHLADISGVTPMLSIDGPYTIFAPEDEAFLALPPDLYKKLEEDIPLLMQVIMYHIVPGKLSLTGIINDEVYPTKQGSGLRCNIYGKNYACGGSMILVPNGDRDHNLLHVVDKVLYPIPTGDIIQTIEPRNDTTKINQLISNTTLPDFLRLPGPYTVFIPSDIAITLLHPQSVDMLLSDPAILEDFILNHVVNGTYFTPGLTEGLELVTIGGNVIRISHVGGLTVNGVPIVQPDIPAINGVIHIINAVLFDPMGAETSPSLPPIHRPDLTVIDVAKALNLTLFVEFVELLGLTQNLTLPGPYTLFVPSDDAFRALPPAQFEAIRKDKDRLRQVLFYHMSPTRLLTSDLTNEMLVPSFFPERDIRINVYVNNMGPWYTASGSQLIRPNNVASNGVVHVVHQVLYVPLGDIVTTVEKSSILQTLRHIIDVSGLKDELRTGHYTLFAPNDQAFKKLPIERVTQLLTVPDIAKSFIRDHVMPNTVYTEGIFDEVPLVMLSGSKVNVRALKDCILLNVAAVQYPDVTADNGVVHVIDRVL